MKNIVFWGTMLQRSMCLFDSSKYYHFFPILSSSRVEKPQVVMFCCQNDDASLIFLLHYTYTTNLSLYYPWHSFPCTFCYMNGGICVPSNELLEKSYTTAQKKCICRYLILLPREKFSWQTAAGTEIILYISCSVNMMKFHSSYILIPGCVGFGRL
jgi:hypothetical protein